MSIRKRWLSAITIASIALSACSQTTTSSDNGSPAEPTPSTSLSSTPPSSPSPTPFATADSSTAPPSQVTPSPTPTETSTTEDPEATMSETPIRIVIGDESLDTTLSDNPQHGRSSSSFRSPWTSATTAARKSSPLPRSRSL